MPRMCTESPGCQREAQAGELLGMLQQGTHARGKALEADGDDHADTEAGQRVDQQNDDVLLQLRRKRTPCHLSYTWVQHTRLTG